VRQCQRLMHEIGFTLQRPRRKAHEADPLKQKAFKKTSTDG
jgi:transposase